MGFTFYPSNNSFPSIQGLFFTLPKVWHLWKSMVEEDDDFPTWGTAYFQRQTVGFRECSFYHSHNPMIYSNMEAVFFFEDFWQPFFSPRNRFDDFSPVFGWKVTVYHFKQVFFFGGGCGTNSPVKIWFSRCVTTGVFHNSWSWNLVLG